MAQSERTVIALHGGPGAPTGLVEVARGLGDQFRTLAPVQRRSGDVELTVDVHVEDLRELVERECPKEKPALVGGSWGAMLALAYACKYPATVECVALAGCGTYSQEARDTITPTRLQRIRDHVEKHPEHRADLKLDPWDQVMKWHGMTDNYCPVDERLSEPSDNEGFDERGFEETWGDMMRCQREHIYPEQFTRIACPVVMLHGAYDPHPGVMTRDNLRQFMPQLEYIEFEKCGHDPWVEKYAHDEFFAVLAEWLRGNTSHRC